MPVPSAWTDIFDTASSNSPQGSETVGPIMNEYLQAAYAYCKQLYEGQINPTQTINMNSQTLTGLANGANPTDAVAFGQLAAYLPLSGGAITGDLSLATTLEVAGALTVGGDITGLSDESLKADWTPLSDDFVDMLAGALSGVYTRIDTGARQVGVGAQTFQNILPEAVIETDSGKLSVAYGQAGLVCSIEIAKELIALRKRVAELEKLQ